MESHRHWWFTSRFRHQPLETICCTHRQEWSCTTYFVFCLEFLCQVGALSANSNPGADEHKGHFLRINTLKTGRHIDRTWGNICSTFSSSLGTTLLLIERGYNLSPILVGYQDLFLAPLSGVIAWGEYSRVCLFALKLSNFYWLFLVVFYL